MANALFAASAFDLARGELDTAATVPTNQETAPVLGMLALTRALVAAAENRPGDVDAPLDTADELAEYTGEAPGPHSFGFGPTNVGLWRMSLALEVGEPDRAVSVAQGIEPERHPFATRQAAYWIDYGRALAQLAGSRDQAVSALRTAERLFPTRVYRNPFAREAVADLIRRARKGSGGMELRGLAYRMGITQN